MKANIQGKQYTYFVIPTKVQVKLTCDNKRQAIARLTQMLSCTSEDLICLGINL